jgi:hypothetical protein
MFNRQGKWWLATVVLTCCLAPATFAARGRAFSGPNQSDAHNDPSRGCNPYSRDRKCAHVQVPEGGTAAIYLLGAGLTCFGAMFLRSKALKPAQP